MSTIYSVSKLTSLIKKSLENTFPYVWVQGQVVNCSRSANGHIYFNLRDENSNLSAAWFKGRQKGESFDPLTGEVYDDGPRPSLADSLENGMDVICAGRLEVYAQKGIYQMMVELAQKAGISRFQVEFEKLKAELARKGYFNLERKRPLPKHPCRVVVITSVHGAAVHDFLRIADKRGFGAEIRIHPAPVQGEEAPAKLAEALAAVNDKAWGEVVVLIRGGGSLEDLWAFNTKTVADAVYGSAVPVVAGIGHEVDVSLADMTADMRAATPSHAAQLLWPDRAEYFRSLDIALGSLERASRHFLERQEDKLLVLSAELAWRSPERVLSRWADRLNSACERIRLAGMRLPRILEERLERLAAGLNAARTRLPRLMREVESREQRLNFAGRQCLQNVSYSLDRLTLQLVALDPYMPLERGYALVRKEDGRFVRQKDMAVAGERLRILVKNGEIPVRVEGVGE